MIDFCIDPQRSSPSSSQKSSRNDYMKSGLYSTFTIQSLQASPNPRPIKTELLLQQDPTHKVDCMPREVRVCVCACVFMLIFPLFFSSHLCFSPLPPAPLPQVIVLAESKSPPSVGGAVDSALQVIVTHPSPCPTPALSPQIPANTANQSQVRMRPRPPLGHCTILCQLQI